MGRHTITLNHGLDADGGSPCYTSLLIDPCEPPVRPVTECKELRQPAGALSNLDILPEVAPWSSDFRSAWGFSIADAAHLLPTMSQNNTPYGRPRSPGVSTEGSRRTLV